ncbi:MAG: putative glycoside hydrolase [Acidimicrobiia bacterium]
MGEDGAQTGAAGGFHFMTPGAGTLRVSKPGWVTTEVSWDGSGGLTVITMEPMMIRGVRVWAGAAGDDALFSSLLDLADTTAVNALVFDTKDAGLVLYETGVAQAIEIGAVDPQYDPRLRIDQAREHGLYLLTRIVVFEDRPWVTAHPEDKLAGPWVDPRAEAAWDYNIALGVEACELGFDEIQFDYVRFPAGRSAEVSGQRDLSQEQRLQAIGSFLARARQVISEAGCAVSADIFSIVVSSVDDQGIGQRPEELSAQVDVLSPMIYPSHYSLGWLGYPDPNDYPYEVTADAIDDSLARLAPTTVLRPWLQAFWWSNAQIRVAIQAAEDRGVGWMLWNVVSNYDLEAIPTDEEVAAAP